MFISIWKYLFLNGDFSGISTGATLSEDITKYLLTAYQKDKVSYIQYNDERLSQIKSNNLNTITTY